MGIEKVIKQLESILDHTRSMAASPDADNIWRKDINALEFALTALRSMPETTKPGWISVKERLPDDEKDGETVLAVVSGKPHENITLCHTLMTAGYFPGEGWVVNEYPEWENPTITHWMPLPEPPEEG